MDKGGEEVRGASVGSGVGESKTRGGETDIESRMSIIAMQIGRSRINCQQNYSGS
jgi:hypothetical protein